ncbi:heparin lyase I family protein [Dongia sp.]|uniref:heparin lyase I family protein n=1 Tax=Dongia sp. TaxID=1977262 RepID=UPI0037515BA3
MRGYRAAVAAGAGLAAAVLFCSPAAAGPCAPPPPDVVTVTYSTQSSSALEDGFEDGKLDRHWSLKHIDAKSHAYTTAIVREGRQALLLTVRHGDKQATGAEADRCSERAEIMEPPYAMLGIGPDVWYGFALYLPADLPPIDRRLILAQIKQPSAGIIPTDHPAATPGYRSGNPVVALRLRETKSAAGEDLLCFSVTPGNDGETHKQHIAIVELKRSDAVGRWHNIVLHAKIVPMDAVKSRLDFWFDDQAVPRQPDMQKPIAIGYAQAEPTSYFKIGPYRDQAKPGSAEVDKPWTFGLDAFKRAIGAESYAEVAPPAIRDAQPLGPTSACEKALRRAG